MSQRWVLPTALAALACGAQAQYSFAADFNIAGNPNGVWSYGYSYALGGFNLFTTGGASSLAEYWYTPGLSGDNTPSAYKNITSGNLNGLQPNEVALHSGPSGEYAIARFTAPTAGDVLVNAMFGAGDSGAVDVHVLMNIVPVFSKFGTTTNESFLITFAVEQGDTIDFVVGYAGDYRWDTTPLAATLDYQPVPEPATLAALGLGAVALIRRRKRD